MRASFFALLLATSLGACGDDDGFLDTPDTGSGDEDTGPGGEDAGPAEDAGPQPDSGPAMDSGPVADSGPAVDSGPACMPLADDNPARGSTCVTSATCPMGYECQARGGPIGDTCEIVCTMDCECPGDLRCVTMGMGGGAFSVCDEPM